MGEGPSRDELGKERLIGEVRGPFLRTRQRRTAAEAKMWDAGTQEVERHVGNSSIGPTLRTQTNILLWKVIRVQREEPIWGCAHQNFCRFVLGETDHSEQSAVLEVWVELHQSRLCVQLPLNKTTKTEHEKHSVLEVLSWEMQYLWALLKLQRYTTLQHKPR